MSRHGKVGCSVTLVRERRPAEEAGVRSAVARPTALEPGAGAALASRTATDLAQGVITAQSGCGQEQAVEILRRASINRNTTMRDIASQILARFGDAEPTTQFN
jgi:hypothetical protein